MFKRRLIAVLFLKDGWMVRSETFSFHQYLGDPVTHVRRMMDWNVDELIVIDIGDGEMTFEHQRQDFRHKPVKTLGEFISLIAVECHMPLTFGGRIRTVEDARRRIQNGADKVVMNTVLVDNPDILTETARSFGSQAVVASIDYRIVDGVPRAYVDHGKRDAGIDPVALARQAESMGAGEIFLNSIDRDGMGTGYDLETIDAVSNAVRIPVIACGGAGMQGHFMKCYENTGVSAVAAGNIFHFKENAYPNAKKFLKMKLADIR